MHPDGRVQRLRPAIGRPAGPRGMPGSRRARRLAGHRRRRRARRARPRRPHRRRMASASAVRRGAVLRRPDARRDRRPRRALARDRGRVGVAAPGSRVKLERPRRRAGGRRRRAAARHVPPAVGVQGGRRLAGAAVPPRRARSSSSRRPTPTRSASARATASRSGPTARACRAPCKLRAAVPGGSVFLAEGTHEQPANVLTEPLVEVRRVGGAEPTARARSPRRSQPAAEGLAEVPASAPLPIPPAPEGRDHDARTQVGYYEPWWMQILKALAIFVVVFNLVPIALLADRKVLGRFQHRYGPNRVGPFGVLQPIADIGKLVFKEQFRPRTSIGWLFALAPVISMITAAATIAIIPFSDVVDIFGTHDRALRRRPVDRHPLRVRLRRHRLLRADARRLGVGLEVLVPRLDARRRPADLLRGRAGPLDHRRGDDGRLAVADRDRRVRRTQHIWFFVPQFVGFMIFLVAGFAETNRPPFDLAEADAELVGGYNTEYGGGRFAAFFAAEYLNMVVVSGADRDAVLRRLGHPVLSTRRHWVDPIVVIVKMLRLRLLLHLGPRDAAAPALRPADVARLEDPAAAGDAQRPRDRDPGGGST